MTARHVTALAFVGVMLGYFGVVLPRRTGPALDRLREQITHDPDARVKFYYRYLALTVVVVEAYAVIVVVVVGGEGFASAGAGWSASAARLLAGAVAAIAAFDVTMLGTLLVAKLVAPAALDKETQRRNIDFLLPATPRERAMWPLVAFGIGVLEELMYRGLFVLYAAALAGISPWWLVGPTSVVFGIGHRYQGRLGVVVTTWIGLALAIVTVVTGSLWPAIVAHTAFDLRLMFLKRPRHRALVS